MSPFEKKLTWWVVIDLNSLRGIHVRYGGLTDRREVPAEGTILSPTNKSMLKHGIHET